MGNANRNNGIVYLITAVLFFLVACSVQNHYSTLSFFFDGVPDPGDIHKETLGDSIKQADSFDSTGVVVGVAKPDFFMHSPYLERKCDFCHNQEHMGSPKIAMPGLCTQCHSTLAKQQAFEHGPAVGGYCTQCHSPHQAKEENLLKITGRELCLNCHDAESLYQSEFHESNDEMDCVSCHNPHSSNNHSLLQSGACTQCHEEFAERYKVIHGPVAGGNCSACHAPHRDGSEKHLLRNGQGLCLYCHDAVQVLKNESHVDIGVANCTDCHNPHGGEDRYIFN